MPWSAADATRHSKDLTAHQQTVWARVANAALSACTKDGGTQDACEASAIRQANAAAKRVPEQEAAVTATAEAEVTVPVQTETGTEPQQEAAGGPVPAGGGPTGTGGPTSPPLSPPQPVPVGQDTPVRRTRVLAESVALREADREQGVLDVVIIRPGWSANNRYYPADVLAAAAPKLEGARAFGDHAADGERPERSIWSQLGYYRGVSVAEDGAITGQLKLVGATDRKQHVLDWASESIAQGTDLMGISINAIGRVEEGTAEGREGEIVAELVGFESADVVSRPAAGGRFMALAASAGDGLTQALLAALTYDEWRQAHPDYASRLLETAAPPAAIPAEITALEAQVTAAQATVAESATELAELRAEHARLALAERADAALDGARVPFVHRPPIRAQLVLVPEAQWPTFLETQARLLAAAAPAPQVRGAGPLAAPPPPQPAVRYEIPTVAEGETYRDWLARRNGAAVATR